MPFEIVRNDITKMDVDAIVNAANEGLRPGGGVCGAIHAAAGPLLARECASIGHCDTGSACLTRGYGLRSRYVIHAVGPVWMGGNSGEKELLASCYRSALTIAQEKGMESIAFPLISGGIYGYPRDEAIQVAKETIRGFLTAHEPELQVYLVLFGDKTPIIEKQEYETIRHYIGEFLSDGRSAYSAMAPKAAPWPEKEDKKKLTDRLQECIGRSSRELSEETVRDIPENSAKDDGKCFEYMADMQMLELSEEAPYPAGKGLDPRQFSCSLSMSREALPDSLEKALGMIDESFSDMVLRTIDEKDMTDPECYKRANVDRKLFSKLRSDPSYRPKKQTALAFAIALRLSLEETADLLLKAGFALSNSNKGDIIVRYCIEHSIYDIDRVNDFLYAFDQLLLGGRN